ncbi:MAG: hypothetical protein V1799_13430 [bacterium]
MKKSTIGLFVAGAIMASVIAGCTSRPNAEELKQLESLKAEVSSLEREIGAKQSEKAALQRAIAEKNTKLAQCEKEKALVGERLKGM